MNNFPDQHHPVPVIAQLIVLLVILAGLFGTLTFLYHTNNPEVEQISISPMNVQPLPPASTKEQTIGDITIQGAAAFVWDANTKTVLFEKNPDVSLPLASITKLMTTLLAYEIFDPETRTSLPLAAILQSGDMGLIAGEEFVTKDLHNLALISSSNDAAFALGATVGEALGERNPTAQFVTGMNIRADELGLDSLEFKNTTGLDVSISEPGATGSAKDVSFLMEYIIANYPELLDSTTQTETKVYNTSGEYHEAFNTNELVGEIPNLLGSKTGFTDLAGGNLTIAFDAGINRPIIITVLGSTRSGRFDDVSILINEVQRTFASQ